MIPNMNTPGKLLVDGGWLVFAYGLVGLKSWVTTRRSYTMGSGALILMDSRESARREFFPDYKSHRKSRHNQNPEKAEAIRSFKELLNEDPSLRKIEATGLEADDLVAIFITEGYDLPVRGRDKDLLSIPGIQLSDNGGDITLHHYSHKLQKRLAPLIKTPDDVLFSLVLLGDSSDDIPRLLPPRAMDLGAQLLSLKNPWPTALKLFGEKLLTNLYLAVLPGPFCYDPQPTPQEVYDLVSTGQWPPRGVLRKDVKEQLEELEARHVISR